MLALLLCAGFLGWVVWGLIVFKLKRGFPELFHQPEKKDYE